LTKKAAGAAVFVIISFSHYQNFTLLGNNGKIAENVLGQLTLKGIRCQKIV